MTKTLLVLITLIAPPLLTSDAQARGHQSRPLMGGYQGAPRIGAVDSPWVPVPGAPQYAVQFRMTPAGPQCRLGGGAPAGDPRLIAQAVQRAGGVMSPWVPLPGQPQVAVQFRLNPNGAVDCRLGGACPR